MSYNHNIVNFGLTATAFHDAANDWNQNKESHETGNAAPNDEVSEAVLSNHQLLNFVVLITNYTILEFKINWWESVISGSNENHSSIADRDLNSLTSFVVSVHSCPRKGCHITSWGALKYNYVDVCCFRNDDIDHCSISIRVIFNLYMVVACWIAYLSWHHVPERKGWHRHFLPTTFCHQFEAVDSASLCSSSSFAIWVCDIPKCGYRWWAHISTHAISFALCRGIITAAPLCALSSVITVEWPTWSK